MPDPSPDPAAKPYRRQVTIEIGDERNRSVLFGPTQQILRGRWSRINLTGDELVEALSLKPDIPGMYVTVDGQARRLMIEDPLSLPENRDLLARLAAQQKADFRESIGPHPAKMIEQASDGQIKTWLFWMRRLVAGRPLDETDVKGRPPATVIEGFVPQARVVKGELPRLEEILALPGKTRIGHFNSQPKEVLLEDERRSA